MAALLLLFRYIMSYHFSTETLNTGPKSNPQNTKGFRCMAYMALYYPLRVGGKRLIVLNRKQTGYCCPKNK